MSSEQKKFSPELMGGRSIASKVRGFLGSILDIGKSIRVRLSRITNPDYDAISDIVAERNAILGHEFNEASQRKAKPVDPMLTKANKVIEDLDRLEDDAVVDPVNVAVLVVEPESVVDVPVEVEEDDGVPPVALEVEDEVADIMKVTDDSINDSERIFKDEMEAEMVTNVISIHDHDEVMDQMTIDDPAYASFEDDAPKFPESRPVQRQTTLDVETYNPIKDEAEIPAPWYTDADLIRIGIRAATEDCIETITPMMEIFDEPEIVEEEVVDEMDLKLTDMAVRAMTEDAVENIVIRLAQAAKVAEAIAVPIPEPVEEPEIETVEVCSDISATEVTEVSEVDPIVAVEEMPVVEYVEEDIIDEGVSTEQDKVSVSFRFGTGASGTSSVGIKFRFGALSQ